MAGRYDWETIRAEYEAGASQSELSKRHGVSRTAIQKRIKSEGWMQDVTDVINRLTEAKVAGLVAGCNPQKKAEALSRAAEDKAAVIQRHRNAWPKIKSLNVQAIEAQDFEAAKLAKITAETERIIQDGERKAWGIADKPQENEACVQETQNVAVNIDFSGMTPEQINELGIAMMQAGR